jgi:hypothetical protein
MKMLLFFFTISLVSLNIAASQPIVKVWGSNDSLTHVNQIKQWLEYLDVHENICLLVSFVSTVPKKLEGTTFNQKTTVSNGSQLIQIIKVWIDRSLTKERQKLVMAHEMVHVKQYAKKELIITDKRTWWQGRKFYDNYHQHLPPPWELKAYSLDDKLVQITKPPVQTTASLSSY